MIRHLIAAIATTTMVAVVGATPASAAKPAVVHEQDFDNTSVVPDDPVCGVDVTIHEVGSVKVTEFYNNDGTLARVRAHVAGTTTITSESGEVVNRWAQNITFDPDTLTDTITGNSYNVHAGAGGVLVNDSGRIVIDLTTGEAIVINGPHQAWFGEFDDACAVLAP